MWEMVIGAAGALHSSLTSSGGESEKKRPVRARAPAPSLDSNAAVGDDRVSGRMGDASAMPVSPRTPRSTRARWEETPLENEALLAGLDNETRNAIILHAFRAAKEELFAKGRKNFNHQEQEELRIRINKTAGVQFDTFNAIEQRVSNMKTKGTHERKEGSGRNSKWDDDLESRVKSGLGDHGYEISSPALCSSNFLHNGFLGAKGLWLSPQHA